MYSQRMEGHDGPGRGESGSRKVGRVHLSYGAWRVEVSGKQPGPVN